MSLPFGIKITVNGFIEPGMIAWANGRGDILVYSSLDDPEACAPMGFAFIRQGIVNPRDMAVIKRLITR